MGEGEGGRGEEEGGGVSVGDWREGGGGETRLPREGGGWKGVLMVRGTSRRLETALLGAPLLGGPEPTATTRGREPGFFHHSPSPSSPSSSLVLSSSSSVNSVESEETVDPDPEEEEEGE